MQNIINKLNNLNLNNTQIETAVQAAIEAASLNYSKIEALNLIRSRTKEIGSFQMIGLQDAMVIWKEVRGY